MMKTKTTLERLTPEEGFALTILANTPYKKSTARLRGKALVEKALESISFDKVFWEAKKH